MSMLADLVDRLVGLGAAQTRAEPLQVDEDPHHFWISHNGTLEKHEVPAPLDCPSIESLDDLIAMQKEHTSETTATVTCFYVSTNSIDLSLDESKRREYARMYLETTEQFGAVQRLERGLRLDAAEVIHLLRFDLPGAAPRVVEALRRVDFKRGSDAHSETRHGRESLGNAIEAEAQGTDEIPETFDVVVPVFKGLPSFTYPVTIGIEIKAAEQCFILKPLADSVFEARRMVVVNIASTIRDHVDCPVYLGRP